MPFILFYFLLKVTSPDIHKHHQKGVIVMIWLLIIVRTRTPTTVLSKLGDWQLKHAFQKPALKELAAFY